MKAIAIIPARVGSKRLPQKNFRQFLGKPIIDWVVDEAVKSGMFDKIVVSTDNADYMDNRIVIDKRPEKLLSDEVTVDEICSELLERYKGYAYLCCIYPTAYAISARNLLDSFSFIMNFDFSYCQSVGMLNHAKYGVQYKNDNGGFYWCLIETGEINLMKIKRGIEIPQVDINTQKDFEEAEEHARTLERFKIW